MGLPSLVQKQLVDRRRKVGSAAQVHKGLRLGQHYFMAGDARSRRLRAAIAIVHAHAALFGNAIHRQKTHVVRCELVLDARIAEPDDQFHSAYFFFSDFSAFSAFSGLAALSPPSAASPAGSCLAFLMTSGSAALSSASTTPSTGTASTTSFTAVTWATAWVSSVMNFSLASCTRSEMRIVWPNSSALTSATR